MIKNIILILSLFALLLMLFLYLKSKYNYKILYKYINNYLTSIVSARYGNLNIKTPVGINKITKKLEKNTNALIESINDRDKMIQEYIQKEIERQNLKQDFILSLAHDLKVPLIAQDNTYDLFLNEKLGKLSENQIRAIKNLKISNNDLKKLLLDILDVKKFENNQLQLNLELVNLNELIKNVIEQNKSILAIQNKNIYFEFDNDKNEIYLDEFLFKRVLNNLISNAIFHSKNSDNIFIKVFNKENEIVISVIDEGNGIDEKNINNVFKKYYSSAKKYSNISIGLGLYIVNKIVAMHNGKITAKNNKDKGSTFEITLFKSQEKK